MERGVLATCLIGFFSLGDLWNFVGCLFSVPHPHKGGDPVHQEIEIYHRFFLDPHRITVSPMAKPFDFYGWEVVDYSSVTITPMPILRGPLL